MVSRVASLCLFSVLVTSLFAVTAQSDNEGRDSEGKDDRGNEGRRGSPSPTTTASDATPTEASPSTTTSSTAPTEEPDDDPDDNETEDPENGGDSNRSKAKDNQDDDEDEEDDDSADDERRQAGGHEARKPGRLNEENGSVAGRWISFRFTETPCAIEALSLGDTLLFDRVELSGACDASSEGARFELEGPDGRIRLHDAPNALAHFDADEGALVELQVPSAAEIDAEEDVFEFAFGNRTARLYGSEDGRLEWDHSQTFTVSEGRAKFWAHPQPKDDTRPPTPVKEAVQEAIERRAVAGEIDVLVADGQVSQEVLAYDNVTIQVSRKNESAFRVLVDADLTEGRTFVLNLAPGAFAHEKVGVRYFDLDSDSVANEVAITKGDGLQDILLIEAGEGPEYWIVKDEAGTHVLVSVPHWSAHMFEVNGLPPEIVPILTYGVVLGIAFVLVAAVGMFLGRRHKPMPA